MVAFACYPEPWTMVASTGASPTAPVSNMGLYDWSNMTYRSTSLTAGFTVLSTCATPIDCVALVGTNLRQYDAVRIRIGATQAAAEGEGTALVDIQMPAWSGVKTDIKAPMTVLLLPQAVQGKYVRVDVTATGHPAGYVEIGSLVVGSAVREEGVGTGAELSINDPSSIISNAGFNFADRFPVGQSYKASFPYVTERSLRAQWHPMLAKAGNTKPVLFVPNYELKANVNLLRDSQTMASANGWTTSGAMTWTRNADYGPDGSLTASTIYDGSTTALAYALGSAAISTDVASYTASVYIKKGVGPIARLLVEYTGGTTSSTAVNVDPATGATSVAGTVVDAGDYWRVWRPITNNGANTAVRIRMYPAMSPAGSALTASDVASVGTNVFAFPQITTGSGLVDWCPTSQTATADTHYAAMQQNDAVFGVVSKATSKLLYYDICSVDITVLSSSL
ncbi:MAG: hypothetical protein AABZ76_07440 [Pseudomonadota bacterium]